MSPPGLSLAPPAPDARPVRHSAVYEGRVRHRRFGARPHAFSYRLFMLYVDLAELPRLFERRWLWSARRPNLAWFRRADYLGDPAVPLDAAVRELVAQHTGRRPYGPIRMLAHLRYFGTCFNPITVYYVFDANDDRVETLVADVHNTPWGERHSYVLPIPFHEGRGALPEVRFNKAFHVSPFMDLGYVYRLLARHPGRQLTLHLENLRGGQPAFDATLQLQRRELTGPRLAAVLWRYPFMTARVLGAIYWQALHLWIKGVPTHPHPART